MKSGPINPDYGPDQKNPDQKIRTTDRTKKTRTKKIRTADRTGPFRTGGPGNHDPDCFIELVDSLHQVIIFNLNSK